MRQLYTYVANESTPNNLTKATYNSAHVHHAFWYISSLSLPTTAKLVPRVLSYPPYGARERVGRKEPWNEVELQRETFQRDVL